VRARFLSAAVLAGGTAVAVAAQAPPASLVQNGRVETKAATSIDREIAAVGTNADPVWIAWREPMVDGEHNMCSTWFSDRNGYVRGDMLEANETGVQPPKIAQPTGPVALEGGTNIIVLARILNGQIERLRSLSDDCPMDAGGRTFVWLTGITSTESLRFLESYVRRDNASLDQQRRFADSAASAIALHRDPAADAILDRIASSDPTTDNRRRAGTWLGQFRGAHGFASLRSLIASEKDPQTRQSFVTSLAQTRQPGTADALLALAQNDADPKVRAEAAYWYPQRAGAGAINAVTAIIDKDTDDNVKRRAVSGLGRLPNDQGVPTLIDLAKSLKSSPIVRKQAVTVLGQSKDPRAVAYLEELLK
jgi:hypothetical protein